MMKKFLVVLGLLFISAGSAFAYSNPRWSIFPLTVYVSPENPKAAAAVKDAFATWQQNSNSILRFFYKETKPFKKSAQITVTYTDYLPGDRYYEIRNQVYNLYYTKGYYVHLDIVLRTKETGGKNVSRDKMYAAAMQAVGSAMGIRCLHSEGNVMSCDSELKNTKITQQDKDALTRVYKRCKRCTVK